MPLQRAARYVQSMHDSVLAWYECAMRAHVTYCVFNTMPCPAVKVGIDTGPLTSDLSPATARLAYRGQPMARVARVVEKVPSGQVWCTEDTVMHAGLTQPTNILRAEEVGDYTLKVRRTHGTQYVREYQ